MKDNVARAKTAKLRNRNKGDGWRMLDLLLQSQSEVSYQVLQAHRNCPRAFLLRKEVPANRLSKKSRLRVHPLRLPDIRIFGIDPVIRILPLLLLDPGFLRFAFLAAVAH